MYLLLSEYAFRFTRMTLSDFTVTKSEVQVGRRPGGTGPSAATSSRNRFSRAAFRRLANWRTKAM
jgi:hypothetical protein